MTTPDNSEFTNLLLSSPPMTVSGQGPLTGDASMPHGLRHATPAFDYMSASLGYLRDLQQRTALAMNEEGSVLNAAHASGTRDQSARSDDGLNTVFMLRDGEDEHGPAASRDRIHQMIEELRNSGPRLEFILATFDEDGIIRDGDDVAYRPVWPSAPMAGSDPTPADGQEQVRRLTEHLKRVFDLPSDKPSDRP